MRLLASLLRIHNGLISILKEHVDFYAPAFSQGLISHKFICYNDMKVEDTRGLALKALLLTNVLNEVTAAPFSVSFFVAVS